MKNVQRALATSVMVLGLVGAGGATAFAQPTGSLGGDGPDIKLSKGTHSLGCAVLVENVGTETAEGVTVKPVLGTFPDDVELGDIEPGESAKADYIDCQMSMTPLAFYGTTSNGDTNLFNNFAIAYP